MLGYYYMSASLMPFEFFHHRFDLLGGLLLIGRHLTSLRPARLQTSRLLS
jgi:hypothetical protein